MRVFIADDSDLLCQRLGIMLSEIEGVEIAGQAKSAREAISAITLSNPDGEVVLGTSTITFCVSVE